MLRAIALALRERRRRGGWDCRVFQNAFLEEVPFSTTINASPYRARASRPSAPLKEASRLLLGVASTPPMSAYVRRGVAHPIHSHLMTARISLILGKTRGHRLCLQIFLHEFCNTLISGGELATRPKARDYIADLEYRPKSMRNSGSLARSKANFREMNILLRATSFWFPGKHRSSSPIIRVSSASSQFLDRLHSS
jgi:hypothetical protein